VITRYRKGARLTLLSTFLIIALMFGGLPATQAQAGIPPVLFGDAGDILPTADVPDEPQITRSRHVTVEIGSLFNNSNGKPLDKQSLPEVTLNLFSDTSYTGVLTNVKQDEWSTTWKGRLKGKQQGYFYLVVTEDIFLAHVASAEGVYEVSWAGDGLYKVVQIDQSKFVDHDPAATFDAPGEILAEGDLDPTADTGAVIDIMIVYTDDARAAEGSTPAMKARIAMAVAETNTSYANAGVTTRLRLVHVEEYSYVETGNLSTDLSRLTNTSDAHFTTVHSLRNTYAADMVGLIVENGGAYCGLANAIMATASNAFQVTDRSCATGYYSFGHEFGHLQGARHDTTVDPTNTPYSYGHGYVHTGSSAAQRWRTVMAYDTKCNNLGYSCTRLQYWSNPAKVYLAAPMGVTDTKNYLVLNNTDTTVANFRTARIADNFNSNFNGSSSGWSPVNGSWALNSGMYYRTTGVVDQLSSAKHTGIYGDLTYEARMKRTGCIWCPNGLIIRGNPTSLTASKFWKSSYLFEYSKEGRFGIHEYSSTGVETTLKGWTSHAAIVQGNNWNTLKVVAVGSTMKFYINNVLVWTVSDSTFATRQVGLTMYRDSASTGNALLVDWAKLSTTPTADFNMDEPIVPGEEFPGGDGTGAPQ
jgi:hypothetical protein